ncbi:MAG: hypothetical protein HRT46_12195 [Deltaproteobacteria bacterium]|jgi:outer membrane murein-binding lipoprotein Lpp|nr:hypothetical protein [Deltaproteobacteria bacterium]
MASSKTTMLIGAVIVSGAFLIGASQSAAPQIQPVYEIPSTKIMTIHSHIVKLNTRTGAIDMLRGAAGATGSGDQWTQRVPEVKGATSGMLDVQLVKTSGTETTFLVEVDGDRTWILKWRGNENGQWQEVRQGPR